MRSLRSLVATGILGAVVVVTGCSGAPPDRVDLIGTFPNAAGGRLTAAVLSTEGTGTYSLSGDSHRLTVSASDPSIGANHREVIWPVDAPSVADSQACATWVASTGDGNQQGLAFRIVSRPEWTKAITVTKNVEFGASWVFNVHTWDSADTVGQPFTQIDQFDMHDVAVRAGMIRPYPWRVCARVEGHDLSFKLWFPAVTSEPSWSNPTFTRRTTALPDSYAEPGRTGWYAGHLPTGGRVSYAGLRTWSIMPASS